VQKASNGTTIAEGTAEALDSIVNGITKVSDLVGEIASASDEQTQGIHQISIGLTQIDDVTQQNTGNAVQCAATSEELAAQAGQLREMLDRFTLYRSTSQISLSMAPSMPSNENKSASPPQPAIGSSSQWGGGTSATSDFIALDDDEFGKF